MSNSMKLDPVLLGGLDLASPTESGHWVNDKVSRCVELIKMYDPNIEVQWVPPENRLPGDPEFRLLECAPNRPPYVMFYVQSADEFDERVLARVIQQDAAKNNFSLSIIDAHNDAVKLMKAKKDEEEAEERADLVKHILKSPKARYRHNGVVYE